MIIHNISQSRKSKTVQNDFRIGLGILLKKIMLLYTRKMNRSIINNIMNLREEIRCYILTPYM